MRKAHRPAEADRFEALIDKHAELEIALNVGDADTARALLKEGVPPPMHGSLASTVNAHPDLVEPLLAAVPPSGIYYHLACLDAFVCGTKEARQAFYQHRCFRDNPRMAHAMFYRTMTLRHTDDERACAAAQELLEQLTPSRRRALIEVTEPIEPRVPNDSAQDIGAAVQNLATVSIRSPVSARLKLALSLWKPLEDHMSRCLKHAAGWASTEYLNLLAEHGANSTAALWSLIKEPKHPLSRMWIYKRNPWKAIGALIGLGGRVSSAELEAYFQSPTSAWTKSERPDLLRALETHGGLIPPEISGPGTLFGADAQLNQTTVTGRPTAHPGTIITTN